MKRLHQDAFERRLKAMLAEFACYLQDRRLLFVLNFLAGMMRGAGFALGFSLFGAVVIWIVQRLALENLPVIGEFFADVVRMVEANLY